MRRRPSRSCPISRGCCAGACSSRTTRASTTPCCAARSPARRWTGPSRPSSARWRWRGGWRRSSAAAGSPRWPTRSGSRSPSPIARCRTPRPARACSARCSAGSARTRATIGEAVALLGSKRGGSTGGRRPRAGARRRPPAERPDFSSLPKDPGVYVFRDADGRPLYVGKSVCLRTRARAHFTTPAAWTGHAEHVDYQATQSELGALLLEDRLIKALRPPGNKRGKRSADGYVYLRCRLDIPFPILEVAPEPATGHAVTVGPVRGRAAAAELVEQLNSLFGLRHCGRRLPRREHPSAYGQMGRCLSPCLGDLDPNLYRERLDLALRLFVDRRDGGAALLAHLDAQRRGAVAEENFERAAWLQRRRERLEGLLRRLGGLLRATHAGVRLVLAPHPSKHGRFDAFWISGGRVVDWGALPADDAELASRSAAALRAAPRRELGGWLPAEEVAETRLVGSWMASHAPPALELDARAIEGGRLGRWVRGVASAA